MVRSCGSILVSTYGPRDRKSTRLNSSHQIISYAVFCLKKKNKFQRDYVIVEAHALNHAHKQHVSLDWPCHYELPERGTHNHDRHLHAHTPLSEPLMTPA